MDTLSVLGKHDPRRSVSDQYNSAAPGVSPHEEWESGRYPNTLQNHTASVHTDLES